MIRYAYECRRTELTVCMEIFLEIYCMAEDAAESGEDADGQKLFESVKDAPSHVISYKFFTIIFKIPYLLGEPKLEKGELIVLFLKFILAMLPIIWLIVALSGLKMAGHKACVIALVITIVLAVGYWKLNFIWTMTCHF